jgi:hypothetical protein
MSAKTRSWEIAEEKRREREAQFNAADRSQPIEAITVDAQSRPTIERAIELFVSDKVRRVYTLKCCKSMNESWHG